MSVFNMTLRELESYEERCRPDIDHSKNDSVCINRNLYGVDLYSDTGFISESDSLFEVIVKDEIYIKEMLGTEGYVECTKDFNIIAKTVFRVLCSLSDCEIKTRFPQLYMEIDKSNYKIEAVSYLGSQVCPFADYNTLKCNNCILPNRSSTDYTITKISNNDTLKISSLMPHLYYDHRFFLGSVPYRISPHRLIEFFDINLA